MNEWVNECMREMQRDAERCRERERERERVSSDATPIPYLEVEALREASCEARVEAEKFVHLQLVPPHHHHQTCTVVLHFGEKRTHGVARIRVGPALHAVLPGQVVGLVKEQGSPHGLFETLLHRRTRLTHELPLEVEPVPLHEVVLPQHTVRVEELVQKP